MKSGHHIQSPFWNTDHALSVFHVIVTEAWSLLQANMNKSEICKLLNTFISRAYNSQRSIIFHGHSIPLAPLVAQAPWWSTPPRLILGNQMYPWETSMPIHTQPHWILQLNRQWPTMYVQIGHMEDCQWETSERSCHTYSCHLNGILIQ